MRLTSYSHEDLPEKTRVRYLICILEYYLDNFGCFGHKNFNKQEPSSVSLGASELVLGVRGSIPGLAMIFLQYFEIFFILKKQKPLLELGKIDTVRV